MKLEYGEFHALFTGDVTEDGEMAVARTLPSDWKCHYYKVAHHGSRYSNSELLLNQLQPDIAVISCGRITVMDILIRKYWNDCGRLEQQYIEQMKAGQLC
mgnify:CR=1 FL=1